MYQASKDAFLRGLNWKLCYDLYLHYVQCFAKERFLFHQVWDMHYGESERGNMPPCLHSITNIAPVARIKWRPHRKNHISSCSLHIDFSINVWDVGRPYIPFAAFDSHTDIATCEFFNLISK